MEHVNGWCFRGIYKGGLWENDLHVSALLRGMRLVQKEGRRIAENFNLKGLHRLDINDYLFTFFFIWCN